MPEETKPAPAKPGYKTTEFYLSAFATLIGLLFASGAIHDGGATTADKIAGLAVAALATAGYSVSRGMTKAK